VTPPLTFEELPRLLVAALGGLAVGVERAWLNAGTARAQK